DLFNRLYIAIKRRDVSTCMDVAEEISMNGIDIGQFALDFTWYFRNLLLLRVSKAAAERIEISTDKLSELKEVAKIGEENDLYRYIRIFSKLSADIKYSTSKRTELEIALIKLCRPEMEEDRESLIARINKLEEIIESGEFTGIKKAELSLEKEEEEEIKAPVVKALPEDIKKIAASFGSIINDKSVKNPLKTVLYNARPYYSENGNA
ncbi:DNA polymerase III subunit gamma and tau domain III, partial [Fusobacterium sp. CM21]